MLWTMASGMYLNLKKKIKFNLRLLIRGDLLFCLIPAGNKISVKRGLIKI